MAEGKTKTDAPLPVLLMLAIDCVATLPISSYTQSQYEGGDDMLSFLMIRVPTIIVICTLWVVGKSWGIWEHPYSPLRSWLPLAVAAAVVSVVTALLVHVSLDGRYFVILGIGLVIMLGGRAAQRLFASKKK